MSLINRNLTANTKVRESAFKRLFDILLSSFGLLLFSPFFLLFALAIVIEEWGPVFYTQTRIGKNGEPFEFYKFRTMRTNADELPPPEKPTDDDNRITKVGKFLRVTAMNELPQIINILKGDMSFVGPRPDMPNCVEKNARELEDYHLRHKIRPGLTGPAQIFTGKHSPEHQKLRFDLLYVEKGNLCMDFLLILRSVGRTLGGRWEV